jgi:hypothetical protein
MKPWISPAHSATFPHAFRTPESPHLYLSDTRDVPIRGAI